MLPQYLRPGKLWYVSDDFIWDNLPANYRVDRGRPLECSSKLSVLNPQDRTANVEVRFYHVDRPPTEIELSIGRGEIETVELSTLPQIPHKQSFWIIVESDIPVLPQAVHADYTFWGKTPDALISVAPYPGPLEDETIWIHPDCYQGGFRWYEREFLTLLNPGKEVVNAHVRYFLRGRELGAEEEVEIPGERVVALRVWDRAPLLLGTENGPPVRVMGDYAIRVDATGPVVTQTTRRARWAGSPSIVGARSLMGFPLRGRGHDLWYYPAGGVIDRGVLPRGQNCDVTWNLLFTHNLDEKEKANAALTFHYGDGASRSAKLEVPPLRSDLQWLHLKPWLGDYVRVNEPYAMSVTADRPVVPEVTCAEFEMWSQVCPGAMSSVNFHPGPLTEERTWWLGIGQAGGADDMPNEWSQTYHLFNPGTEKVRVTLSFLGFGQALGKLNHIVDVGPGAVMWIKSSEIEGLPIDQPFVVRADGNAPFCAQTFVRAFTRGLSFTRSMYSIMGVPMKLSQRKKEKHPL